MSDNSERAAGGGGDHGSSGGRWLQLGLVSATVAAPLIARWRSLAEDDRIQALQERATTLRKQTAERLAEASQNARSLRRSLRRARADGAVSAGDEENASVARAIAPLVALVPDTEISEAALAAHTRRRAALTASFVAAGVTAGLIAAGAIAYVILRNRALAHEERMEFAAAGLPVDDLDAETLAAEPTAEPADSATTYERPTGAADLAQGPDFAPETVFSDEDGVGAEWIGDIFTREYLPAAAAVGPKLPAPDRRIYFGSETQAQAAGYHRDGFGAERNQ